MRKNCKELIDYPRGTRWGDFDSQTGEDGCQRKEDKIVGLGGAECGLPEGKLEKALQKHKPSVTKSLRVGNPGTLTPQNNTTRISLTE